MSDPFVDLIGAPATLADVLPALLAAVLAARATPALRPGAPGEDRAGEGPLAPGPSPRACLLLVDGLGSELLREHRADAPFLSSLLPGAPVLPVGFPTTTATSLGSLGTGLPPGRHGLVGLETVVPGQGWALNALRWDARVGPRRWQPHRTVFERAAASGVAVTRVGPRAFDGTGLTEAALRGGRYAPAETAGERLAATLAALEEGRDALVYCYYGDLDATGHRQGARSVAWRMQLALVDRVAEQLADRLPPDCLLWVTGDHGMVDPPRAERLDLADLPALRDGVALVTGEPRARYVHARAGAAADVLAAWGEVLDGRMRVLSREAAVAAGWYGDTVSPDVLPRIGDVVAASLGGCSLVDSRVMEPWLVDLVGLHGSLTPAEALVPLLEVRT